jgi:hypothetical protein
MFHGGYLEEVEGVGPSTQTAHYSWSTTTISEIEAILVI